MTALECQDCGEKASRLVNGKYYCGDCGETPKPTVKPWELDMAHPDWEPEPSPKKKGFWNRVGEWLEKSNCGCCPGCH